MISSHEISESEEWWLCLAWKKSNPWFAAAWVEYVDQGFATAMSPPIASYRHTWQVVSNCFALTGDFFQPEVDGSSIRIA